MQAKLSPPNASRLLVRPRLHRRLDDARGATAWLVAPAGAGKTSLLATWTAELEQAFIWLRVDSGDRDPATLIDWFVQALPRRRRDTLPVLQRQHLPDPAPFARQFFRAWYDQVAPASTLVIDNLHDATTGVPPGADGSAPDDVVPAHDRAVRAAPDGLTIVLAALIDEKPEGFSLLFSSRQEAATRALRERQGATALCLRHSDLKCQGDEVQALADHLGLAVPPTRLATLASQADGWLAGLSILLRQDPAAPAPQRLVSTDAEVFEAFAGSSFDALPFAARQLLLLNAHTPFLIAEAGTGLMPAAAVAAVLDSLWRSQFFLERRQGPRRRIEYLCHPLLRAFLQERARSHWSPAELASLWVGQAARCLRDGDVEAAIDLYLLAGDHQTAARLVIDDAAACYASGRLAGLRDRLDRLGAATASPDAVLAPGIEASLAYWEGLCLQMTAPAQALTCLRRAHAGHCAAADATAALLDACAILDGYFMQWQAWEEALPWADQALRWLDRADLDTVDPDTEVRVIGCGQSVMFMCPDHPIVPRLISRARAIMQSGREPRHRVAVAPLLIGHARWRGDIDAMRQASRQALEAVDASPVLPQSLLALIWIGVAASADGHACEPARRGMFDRMLSLSRQIGLPTLDFHCWVNRAQEALYFDDIEGVEAAYAEILRLYPGSRGTAGLFRVASLCRLLIHRDWEQVTHLIEDAQRDDADLGGWVIGHQMVQLLLAQARAMLGRLEAAEAALAPVQAFVARWPAAGLQWHAALVRAHVALARGRPADADEQLRLALGIARAQGYRHVHYWWAPDFHLPLFVRALQAGIEGDWLGRLIVDQRLPAPGPGLVGWPYRARIRALGRFRLEIDGKPLSDRARGQARVLALIRALASQGGTALAIDALAADLWPDSDGDAAMSALDVTILRARRLLGDPATLLIHDGRLSLNPGLIDLDLWTWHRCLERIDAALLDPDPEATRLAALANDIEPALSGGLLEGEAGAPWLDRERHKWSLRIRHRALRLARAMALMGRDAPLAHARSKPAVPPALPP